MPAHNWTRVEAGIFAHFHTYWLTEIGRTLNRKVLPKNYYALAEQVAGGFGPDVLTLDRTPPTGDQRNGSSHESGGSTMLLTASPPKASQVFRIAAPPKQSASKRLQIRHVSGHRVVAIIEIISPGNKSSDRGIRSLVEKARELLTAGIHLLLVDLFPATPRDPEGVHPLIWKALGSGGEIQLESTSPNTISYSAGEEIEAFIERFQVGEAIPESPLFLETAAYVLLPLEESYQAAFADVPAEWRERLEA